MGIVTVSAIFHPQQMSEVAFRDHLGPLAERPGLFAIVRDMALAAIVRHA